MQAMARQESKNFDDAFERHRPRRPFVPTDRNDFYPNNSPIINSQEIHMHPDSVIVSQSTNHRPNGVSEPWERHSNTNSHRPPHAPFRPRPSHPHHMHFHAGKGPIINSQISNVHHDGSVTTSMESHEASNSPFRPYSSPSHRRPHIMNSNSGRRPIVNSQMTNGYAGGDRPIMNSQVTDA